MKFDVRDIPSKALQNVPDALRETGLDVEVIRKPHPVQENVDWTIVRCRRGTDVQTLGWGSQAQQPGIHRISIANSSATLWRNRLRKKQLQDDVTSVIEQHGGYSPISEESFRCQSSESGVSVSFGDCHGGNLCGWFA